MIIWLLEAGVRQAMERAEAAGIAPTAEQQARFEARFGDEDGAGGSRILTTAGNTAEIAIQGVITKTPSFMAMIFGGGNTTYAEIVAAIAEAKQDDAVENIVYAIDSPGGQFEGLFDALAAMQDVGKPTKTVFSNTGASAAYALGVQADEVFAANRATQIGSVGIMAILGVDENTVKISSTNAPKKNPDPTTEAGKAIVREELDALHVIFAEAIADGMGVTVEKVNADFGQGATLLAEAALKRGMIDGVERVALRVVKKPEPSSTTVANDDNQPEAIMDLNELQAQHPAVYAAAVQVGNDTGTTAERDRVGAHLTMGEASGDMKTAVAAISDGSAMTATLLATYSAAGMSRKDVNNVTDDDDATAAALALAAQAAEDLNPGETVTSLVETQLGIGQE